MPPLSASNLGTKTNLQMHTFVVLNLGKLCRCPILKRTHKVQRLGRRQGMFSCVDVSESVFGSLVQLSRTLAPAPASACPLSPPGSLSIRFSSLISFPFARAHRSSSGTRWRRPGRRRLGRRGSGGRQRTRRRERRALGCRRPWTTETRARNGPKQPNSGSPSASWRGSRATPPPRRQSASERAICAQRMLVCNVTDCGAERGLER